MKKNFTLLILAIILIGCKTESVEEVAKDPLPSWAEADAKARIIKFVTDVTDPNSANFVAEEDRIAVFDNDGTLWCEKPVCEFAYAYDAYLKKVDNKEIKDSPFAQKIKKEGLLNLSIEDMMEIYKHAYESDPNKLTAKVQDWIKTTNNPRFNRKYTELVYQPMIELLEYMESNGFKNHIVSGGSNVFMRSFAKEIYNIPADRVIGTMLKANYNKDKKAIELGSDLWVWNDHGVKSESIFQHVGRKPIFACGNSTGDFEMLDWASTNDQNLIVLIHHNDAEREAAYNLNYSDFSAQDADLEYAKKSNWVVASMKENFKEVFSLLK